MSQRWGKLIKTKLDPRTARPLRSMRLVTPDLQVRPTTPFIALGYAGSGNVNCLSSNEFSHHLVNDPRSSHTHKLDRGQQAQNWSLKARQNGGHYLKKKLVLLVLRKISSNFVEWEGKMIWLGSISFLRNPLAVGWQFEGNPSSGSLS